MNQSPHTGSSPENKFLYNGKELQDDVIAGTKLDWYDYGARMYDAAIGRWHVVDPLAEKYYSFSTFSFVANNPIGNREVDGRYFEKGSKDERIANGIARRAERRAARLEKRAKRLEAKGKKEKAESLSARAAELTQTAKDIKDMKNDPTTLYKYTKIGSKDANILGFTEPQTTPMGRTSENHNIVWMVTDNKMENLIHESRHGGQAARKEWDLLGRKGYGVSHEVSAYRAQFSWEGRLIYQDHPSDLVAIERVKNGEHPTIRRINNINQINAEVVNSIVDPGFIPIYPPRNSRGDIIIPLHIWNNN